MLAFLLLLLTSPGNVSGLSRSSRVAQRMGHAVKPAVRPPPLHATPRERNYAVAARRDSEDKSRQPARRAARRGARKANDYGSLLGSPAAKGASLVLLTLSLAETARAAMETSDWQPVATDVPNGLFNPATWIAGALFVIGGKLMIDAIQSGGVQQDFDGIKRFLEEKFETFGKKDDEASLKKRRSDWMNKIEEADKPKPKAPPINEGINDKMIYDLDELFGELNEVNQKRVDVGSMVKESKPKKKADGGGSAAGVGAEQIPVDGQREKEKELN
uniref:Uncharacterized protein n=1 Tax=Lotharella oceanica TaxID=641309 RepID=A0A7S2XE48_9EUKA|mmetsp:Transcript_31187/g.58126  ORF Transcript_31187/g.58126 Transcript_31187/m.58126 type:complete len:274 (+) Transcript_31187:67-888(+)